MLCDFVCCWLRLCGANVHAQLEKDKLRQSKKYKGFQLLISPRIKPVTRSSESTINARVVPTLPKIDADLKRIAEKKHLTSLPPHLQKELDTLKAARKQAAESSTPSATKTKK
jgi:hypothetical protein